MWKKLLFSLILLFGFTNISTAITYTIYGGDGIFYHYNPPNPYHIRYYPIIIINPQPVYGYPQPYYHYYSVPTIKPYHNHNYYFGR